MEKDKHIVIHEWMLDLGLKGNELIIFACIYGFSQDGESKFYGSRSYLAKWCGNLSLMQVQTILNKLVANNLIEKTELFNNGVKRCEYNICKNLTTSKETLLGSKETLLGSKETLLGSKETLLNNIDNTINISNNKLLDMQVPKQKKLDYKLLLEEINKRYESVLANKVKEYLDMLLQEHCISTTKQFISRLDKLDTLKGNKLDIVNRSIQNDWKNFYETNNYNRNPASQSDIYSGSPVGELSNETF